MVVVCNEFAQETQKVVQIAGQHVAYYDLLLCMIQCQTCMCELNRTLIDLVEFKNKIGAYFNVRGIQCKKCQKFTLLQSSSFKTTSYIYSKTNNIEYQVISSPSILLILFPSYFLKLSLIQTPSSQASCTQTSPLNY